MQELLASCLALDLQLEESIQEWKKAYSMGSRLPEGYFCTKIPVAGFGDILKSIKPGIHWKDEGTNFPGDQTQNYYVIGMILVLLKHPYQALEFFDKALLLDTSPKQYLLLYHIGYLHYERQQYSMAEKYFLECYAINPSNECFNSINMCYNLQDIKISKTRGYSFWEKNIANHVSGPFLNILLAIHQNRHKTFLQKVVSKFQEWTNKV